jgi:hypothetical protein
MRPAIPAWFPRRIRSHRFTAHAPETTKPILPICIQFVDPETGEPKPLMFSSVKTLRDYVKRFAGVLSLVRPGRPLLILDSRYDLDPSQLYTWGHRMSDEAWTEVQGRLLEKQDPCDDREWEDRCRSRVSEYFEEEGVYVVEQPIEQDVDSPVAEWKGMWKGVDDSIYLLECKSRITAVDMSWGSILIVAWTFSTTEAPRQDGLGFGRPEGQHSVLFGGVPLERYRYPTQCQCSRVRDLIARRELGGRAGYSAISVAMGFY